MSGRSKTEVRSIDWLPGSVVYDSNQKIVAFRNNCHKKSQKRTKTEMAEDVVLPLPFP